MVMFVADKQEVPEDTMSHAADLKNLKLTGIRTTSTATTSTDHQNHRHGAPRPSSEEHSDSLSHKIYRRISPIPKDEARVLTMIPAMRDAASKLYQVCTCIPWTRGHVRPATESDEEYFQCLGDLFRCYRWMAACPDNNSLRLDRNGENYVRFALSRLREGIDVIERIIPFLEPSLAHPWIRAIRDAMSCGVQVLANCTRQCPAVQDLIWPEFFEIVGSLIILEEDKLLNYISATIVNCISHARDPRVDQIVDRGYAARIFQRVSVFGDREDSVVAFEATFELAEFLLHCPVVAQRDFDLVNLSAKRAILNLLSSYFTLSGPQPEIPFFWAEKIASEFKANSKCLLRLREVLPHVDEECELVVKALHMLGDLSSGDEIRILFVSDVLLLDCTIDLFIEIDDLSREANNQFSAVTKLSDVKPQELVTSSRGIKSHLLRLLANLVYNNPEFEKRAAKRDLLQRLKDNAKIDYRNPYVQQWAILAIRNLHFSAAVEEMRKQHEQQELLHHHTPNVAHSLDGDRAAASNDRKLSDGLAVISHRLRGIQHSDTVEALDLHVTLSEPELVSRNMMAYRGADLVYSQVGPAQVVDSSRGTSKRSSLVNQETQTVKATVDVSPQLNAWHSGRLHKKKREKSAPCGLVGARQDGSAEVLESVGENCDGNLGESAEVVGNQQQTKGNHNSKPRHQSH